MHCKCVVALPQAAEEDFNDDGKPDVISIKVQAAPPHPVHSVKALLQFHYTISVSACPPCIPRAP